MKAKIIKGQTTSATRSILADNIPLDTPYVIQIFPVYGCNFRCNYCIHSLNPSERGYIADKKFMDFDLYKKCIDDILEFPQKIKMLRFAATGEPLLHPQIAEMIEYAAQKKAANSIEIVTNGSLLTPELSNKLINSGLNWLRISIQGVSAKKYKEISDVSIDFEEFVKNIRYFYDNKKDTQIYIKIIDCALSEGEEEKFYQIFGDICDKISVEYLLPAVSQINYAEISNHEFEFTQNGVKANKDIEVCPQVFYMMQVNPEGNIVPCCSMETAYIEGNNLQNSLVDIWNGKKRKNFLLMQLNKVKHKNKICKECQIYKYGAFREDILDDRAEQLKTKLL
ncbi:MAG: radical SAM protein [Candidatus Melainabacteria bacterium GWF2_37_15]|nr:MAG: radical SAM protein [Candidatus Melainabacteria bacterium GWF2_37_15]